MSIPNLIEYPALSWVYTRLDAPRRIDMIVLHHTGGKKAGDLFTLRGQDKARQVSCHYYVTKQAEVYQLVRDNDIAYHAGVTQWQGEKDCNLYSIGIEIENWGNGKDPYPEVQQLKVLELCRYLVKRYNVPQSRLVRHLDIAVPPGRKNDPRGFPWETFVKQVYATEQKPVITRDATKRYYIVNTDAAIIRQGPGRVDPTGKPFDVAARLPKGEIVTGRGITFGENIGGDNGWVHDDLERGFIHMSVLDEIK